MIITRRPENGMYWDWETYSKSHCRIPLIKMSNACALCHWLASQMAPFPIGLKSSVMNSVPFAMQSLSTVSRIMRYNN